MVEFDVRIDFFRELDPAPDDYVGSALRDGLRAPVLPRVGEQVMGLSHRGDPFLVAAVEHFPSPAFRPPGQADEDEREPAVVLVFRALWPGDGPLAGPRMLGDYDAQGGWRLHFFSDHAPVEPLPGQPLMRTPFSEQ